MKDFETKFVSKNFIVSFLNLKKKKIENFKNKEFFYIDSKLKFVLKMYLKRKNLYFIL